MAYCPAAMGPRTCAQHQRDLHRRPGGHGAGEAAQRRAQAGLCAIPQRDHEPRASHWYNTSPESSMFTLCSSYFEGLLDEKTFNCCFAYPSCQLDYCKQGSWCCSKILIRASRLRLPSGWHTDRVLLQVAWKTSFRRTTGNAACCRRLCACGSGAGPRALRRGTGGLQVRP